MLLLPTILSERALLQPERAAYRFFQGASLVPDTLNYAQLHAEVACRAQQLLALGLSRQRVLIACKAQRHFVPAFLACLMAGAVAVPTSLPRRDALRARLELIAADALARAVMYDNDDVATVPLAAQDELRHVDMRLRPDDVDAAAFVPPSLDGADLAFLQYTSGSTGAPKGVAVSHANIVANCAAITSAMEMDETSSVLIALPLFHDMGLVGGVLQALYSGSPTGFMAPAEFVQYPERWLQILSRDRITVGGGPNYMFELAAQAAGRFAPGQLDLSALRVAFCGAEPIRAATVRRFADAFAPFGYDRDAFFPCYGMAESTLFITGHRVGATLRIDRRGDAPVVSCGAPRNGATVRIVDPGSGRSVPDGVVGEIWASGASVAQGYWGSPALTAQQFHATLAEDGSGPFLRTGDLGYLDAGELFVSGRLKDLIVVNGRKIAPQDVEAVAEGSHGAVRAAGAAAFSIPGPAGETAVVVCELNRAWLRRTDAWSTVALALRTAVHAELGLSLADVVFIKPGTLPRTSSGKVQRNQCRHDYLGGRFSPDPSHAPAAEPAVSA